MSDKKSRVQGPRSEVKNDKKANRRKWINGQRIKERRKKKSRGAQRAAPTFFAALGQIKLERGIHAFGGVFVERVFHAVHHLLYRRRRRASTTGLEQTL